MPPYESGRYSVAPEQIPTGEITAARLAHTLEQLAGSIGSITAGSGNDCLITANFSLAGALDEMADSLSALRAAEQPDLLGNPDA